MTTFYSNTEAIWIYCNQSYGWFDNYTEHYTGAIGQVSFNASELSRIIVHFVETRRSILGSILLMKEAQRDLRLT